MNIVVSSASSSIYLPKRQSIFSYNGYTGRGRETSIAALSKKANSLSPLVVKTMSKLLAKLSELSIPFHLYDVKIEQDVEIPSWKYAVIHIGLDWRGNPMAFTKICDYLIDYAYAFLSPKESLKILLQFTYV